MQWSNTALLRGHAWQAFEERERGFWAVKKREAGGVGEEGGTEGKACK